ncbi:MAG: hypothetical protein HY619_02290 [Thaumarchaeota archaeon]|nr:hypothetical protein [Nitrososphaerota archaeon]
MPLLLVKMPKNWRKVNVSRFITKHQIKKIDTSLVLEVPENQIKRVTEVLTKNQCEITVAHLEPEERRIAEHLLDLCQQIRAGKEKPKAMKMFTDTVLKKHPKLSDDTMNLIHLAIEFVEEPVITGLFELEEEARELLNKL